MDGPTLSELEVRGTPLPECAFRQVSINTRLYYVPRGDGNGFDFYAVEWMGNRMEDDMWTDPNVECVAQGTAYFDGIRHLYMGDEATDNYGYLNYPNTHALARLFTMLSDLESEMCHSPAHRTL